MLKSLFKPKSDSIDILPPPPPFPTMDFDESEELPKNTQPKLKEDAASHPTTELHDLLKDLEKEAYSKKAEKKLSKKEKIKLKKLELKQEKKSKSLKKSEEKRIGNIDDVEKLWLQDFDDFQDLGIDGISAKEKKNILGKSKKTKSSKEDMEIEFPDTLDEMDVDYVKPEQEMQNPQKQKPKELIDAEQEIRSAIEKIKKQEKQSFFKRLFSTEFKSGNYPAQNESFNASQIEIIKPDKIFQISQKISESREALANLNLEDAKRKYIEAMQIYNQIKPEEKTKVYNDIKELYYERKSAEELRV